jgi:hypothetical protein
VSHKEEIEDIIFNISQINRLMKSYPELLAIEDEPDNVEIIALASIIHSFYNGLEKILISILTIKGKDIPRGDNWHKQVIEELFKSNETEKMVFPLSMKEVFDEYLLFRHFFRHSYSFHLNWNKMKNLVIDLKSNWKTIKTYLKKFLNDNKNL